MPGVLIIGGQWGDEGKAKVIDHLACDMDYVVRFQGGANAGHTVVVGSERFAFHLVPSGILYPHVTCVLGGGMVIDPFGLIKEIDGVIERGMNVTGRIFVSEQAHVVLPHHILLDSSREDHKGTNSIGSTKRGITPAYMDKIGREGIRMCDFLLDRRVFGDYLRLKLREKNRRLRQEGFPTISPSRTIDRLLEVRKRLQPMISDTRIILWDALDKGKNVLFEGAQGTLLDVDHGTYPYVTSSHVTVGGVSTGTGVPARWIDRNIGVFKAYCTRVGNGPFPTEEFGRVGDKLRDIGHEYGTTTGRPRRCGWFDAVAARTAIKLNGFTEVALTKMDVLESFSKIKVCTEYRAGRKRYDYFPIDSRVIEKCKPMYTVFEGWNARIDTDVYEDLPDRAKEFIELLQTLIGCRISMVSLGPERGAICQIIQT